MYLKDFKITEDEIIKGDRFIELTKNTSLSYVKTDFFIKNTRMKFRNELHPNKITKYIISGHSDFSIDKEVFERHEEKFDLWFSTNVDYKHKKLHNVPLGVTNLLADDIVSTYPHNILGNLEMMIEVLNTPKIDDKLVYMNISVHTYPKERQLVYDLFHDKSYVTVKNHECSYEGRKDFLKEIRNHKFCICPRGNGIDTHRLWESLYMGTIPITRREIMHEDYDDLPILFVDDWNEINEEYLNKKYEEIHSKSWNLDKLKMSYWKKRIYDLCHIKENMYQVPEHDYNYYHEKDSYGGDIMYVGGASIETLKRMCDENDKCLGFNTLGFLKFKINSKLININYPDHGIFIKEKKKDIKDNFVFFKSYDIMGGDIMNVNTENIESLKIYCNSIKDAVAFNTLGFIKKDININKLVKSKYFGENDGIYVNMDKYLEIKNLI